VSGANGKLLSLTGLTQASSGWLYRASVTCSDTTLYTSEATLTVPSFDFFTSQPASQSVSENATVTLSYQGAFSAAAYPARWQMRRVGDINWSYYTDAGKSEQSISFVAVASLHHNTEWRAEISFPGDTLYSNIALLTVNKATSIKVVNVSGSADLVGVAYAKGAYVALSSEITGVARRSTDGGNTWTYTFLPASRRWEGIVSTSQGWLIADRSGDSGTYTQKSWNTGTFPNFTTTYSWAQTSPSFSALVARSFDGGLTWDTAVPPFFMGSRVRMWSFPWNNVLIATYRDDTSTSLPPASSSTIEHPGLKFTRFGRHYIAFNYNNGSGDSWARYELPRFAGNGNQILTNMYDPACPDITSVALSPTGMMVCTSRYQGFTYYTSNSGSGANQVLAGDISGTYDLAGYLMYRDLAAGLGAPQVADQSTSGVSGGSSLRTLTRGSGNWITFVNRQGFAREWQIS
jgi:hypothetical protein